MLAKSQNISPNDQKSTKKFEVVKHGNIANQEVLKMNQQIAKTDMRPCIQMAMMRSQKTHPTATLAHHKKHLTIHHSKFDQNQ